MNTFNRFIVAVVSLLMVGNVLYAQEAATISGNINQPTVSLDQALKSPAASSSDKQTAGAVDFLDQTSPLSPATTQENPPPIIDPVTPQSLVGITDGATVSGVITVGPNLQTTPGIKKVAYYVDQTQSGKVYILPFYWGGLSGDGTTSFDTTKLSNGVHELQVVYTTTLLGDHEFVIHFTVNNTVITPICTVKKHGHEKAEKEKKEKEKADKEKCEKEKAEKDKSSCKKKL